MPGSGTEGNSLWRCGCLTRHSTGRHIHGALHSTRAVARRDTPLRGTRTHACMQKPGAGGEGGVRWDAWSSLEVLKEVASALGYLHNSGVLHGDLKAANVLLAGMQGDGGTVQETSGHVHVVHDRRGFVAKVTGGCACAVAADCQAALQDRTVPLAGGMLSL